MDVPFDQLNIFLKIFRDNCSTTKLRFVYKDDHNTPFNHMETKTNKQKNPIRGFGLKYDATI